MWAGWEGISVRGKCVKFGMFTVTAGGESNMELGKDLGCGVDRASQKNGRVGFKADSITKEDSFLGCSHVLNYLIFYFYVCICVVV